MLEISCDEILSNPFLDPEHVQYLVEHAFQMTKEVFENILRLRNGSVPAHWILEHLGSYVAIDAMASLPIAHAPLLQWMTHRMLNLACDHAELPAIHFDLLRQCLAFDRDRRGRGRRQALQSLREAHGAYVQAIGRQTWRALVRDPSCVYKNLEEAAMVYVHLEDERKRMAFPAILRRILRNCPRKDGASSEAWNLPISRMAHLVLRPSSAEQTLLSQF